MRLVKSLRTATAVALVCLLSTASMRGDTGSSIRGGGNFSGLLRKVIPCSAAEVLTFHSVRKEFIPATPGYVILVAYAHIFKAAGPAFTIGTGSFIQGRYNATGFPASFGLPVVGVIDIATVTSGFTSPTTGPATTGAEANAADLAGKSMVSGTGGNVDYTGTGSPITIVIYYYLVPTTAATQPAS